MQPNTPPTHSHKLCLTKFHFEELFQRHLCRHSQFGINVLHMVAVLGIYCSVFSLISLLLQRTLPTETAVLRWLLLNLLSVPWLVILRKNTPSSVFLLTILSTLSLSATAVILSLPAWIHLILLPLWHQTQQFSHRIYTRHTDMSAFREKYPPGRRLALLLAICELPVLIHYFQQCRFMPAASSSNATPSTRDQL